MTRAQLQALLQRNPALSIDENQADTRLPHPLAKPRSPQALEPSAQSKAGMLEGPSVRITSLRCRALDTDNLIGGCKALLDGLVKAGLLAGDGPSDIDTEYRQQKVKHRRQEATIVEIFYPE